MSILSIVQIIVSIFLIILILLQQRGAALDSILGGGGGEFYSDRRGMQKTMLWITVALGTAFIILSLLNLLK